MLLIEIEHGISPFSQKPVVLLSSPTNEGEAQEERLVGLGRFSRDVEAAMYSRDLAAGTQDTAGTPDTADIAGTAGIAGITCIPGIADTAGTPGTGVKQVNHVQQPQKYIRYRR